MLTAMILIGAYGGYHVVRESSVVGGLTVAFVESNADRIARFRHSEAVAMQMEIQHLAKSNLIIDRLMGQFVAQAPTIARARLGVIHNGAYGVTGLGLLRYDVTNAVAGAGHAAGPLAENRSLAEWSDFLPDLLAGECKKIVIKDMENTAARARLEELKVGAFLSCPVADIGKRLLGSVAVYWDEGTYVPSGAEMDRLINTGKKVGLLIAAMLDLRKAPPQEETDPGMARNSRP